MEVLSARLKKAPNWKSVVVDGGAPSASSTSQPNITHDWHQCDQIGRFSKVLGGKLS